MKEKVYRIISQLKATLKLNPAEVLLSVIVCILGCIYAIDRDLPVETILLYFPVFFLITYTLNQFTRGRKFHFIYYLSSLLFLAFYGWTDGFNYPVTMITYGVVMCIYLISLRKIENNDFMAETFRFIKAVMISGGLSGITWLLLISIYFSIKYIFNIWNSVESEAISCISSFSFLLIMPLLFLFFHKKQDQTKHQKWFHILVNYILSPALLIYTAILYLYIIQILISWSLPKGGIAYIVIAFIVAVFFLKGCQPFLKQHYLDWYYKLSSLVVLPALIMFWIGTVYRIHQYGLTELRVYLLIIGIILTFITALFFFKRYGRYYYVICLAIFFLSLFTYIPGITAKNIGEYSQSYREKNGLINPGENTGNFSSIHITNSGSVDITGFTSMSPVYFYKNKEGYWANYSRENDMDSIYLYAPEDQLIFKEDIEVLFANQLKKAGIAIGDTIPQTAYPELLSIDLDSMVFILESISLSRYNNNIPYEVNYMNPQLILKK